MKKTKRRLKVDDLGMVNALYRTGEDWVIVRIHAEFAKRMLEKNKSIDRSDGYTEVGDLWCFETEEYTE